MSGSSFENAVFPIKEAVAVDQCRGSNSLLESTEGPMKVKRKTG